MTLNLMSEISVDQDALWCRFFNLVFWEPPLGTPWILIVSLLEYFPVAGKTSSNSRNSTRPTAF